LIIKSLILNNIRNYSGENVIHFSNNSKGKKNITLIGGLNGAGKTTALESIKLCLYGKGYNGNTLSKKAYYDLITELFNKNAIKNKEDTCYISLNIFFDDVYPSFFLDVTRKWKINGSIEPKEDFIIHINDKPLEFIPKDYWQEYVNHLLPPSITEFFFFNGEKVRELAVGKNADRILKSSIKDLIGLNIYENLHEDLDRLKSRIRRRNEKESEIIKKLKNLEKSKILKNDEIKKIKQDMKQKENQIVEKNDKIIDLQDELKRKAGSYATRKKDIESKILSQKEKKNKLADEIAEIAKNKLPFVMPKKLLIQLTEEIDHEQSQKNFIILNDVWTKEKNTFLDELDHSSEFVKNLSDDEKSSLVKDIDNTFNELSNMNKKSTYNFLHDLTRNEYELVKNYFNQANHEMSKRFHELLNSREQTITQIKKLKTQLGKVPDDSFVLSYLNQIANLKGEIKTLELKIDELSEYVKKEELEKNGIEEEINKTEEEIVCIKEDNQKVDLITNIRKTLTEYTEEMVLLNTKNLEHTISHMYQHLANKDDMVKEIKLDSDNFTTKLIDYDGNDVSKEWISEGEKEIYAISVLWGLSQISRNRMPMIIDTPLSKLDNKHVHNISTKFFPEASDQVVLFSQDREIDKKIYRLLKPYIGKEYTLQHSQKQKILDGYFFN